MKERIKFIFSFSIFWLAFFFVARILFYIYQYPSSSEFPIIEVALSFLHGIRLDLSLTGYILMLSGLLLIISTLIQNKTTYLLFKILTYSLIIIFSFIIITDLELYRNWGYRMDTSAFIYLNTPEIMIASTNIFVATSLIAAWLALSFSACFFVNKIVLRKIYSFQKAHLITTVPVLLLVTTGMLLPIRGSLGIAPINTGSVYFCKNTLANHGAINVVWNFNYALNKISKTNIEIKLIDPTLAETTTQKLYIQDGLPHKILKQDKPNVVLIILESFTSAVIEPLGGIDSITPNLNKIIEEGINFKHIYATASRSDRGLVGILSGYPAHPKTSIMKFPQKTQNLDFICNELNQLGYNSCFYYGGDTDFANMNSYLINSGFSRVVNETLFPEGVKNSKWGVHDNYMFDYLLNEIDTTSQPFFKAFFTLSSHEPFEVPMEKYITGNDEASKYLNSVHYTDKCIGQFFNKAKTKEWYKNTLFVLVADHAVRHPHNTEIHVPDRYSIPMVWTGGALDTSRVVINKIGSQIDIASTLLNQISDTHTKFKFSKDLLNPNTEEFAIYFFNKGFGYVSPKGTFAYSLETKDFLFNNTQNTEAEIEGKALFQQYIKDFNSK